MKKLGLSNNQLKIIAMICMTLDHVGFSLYPEVTWLRILGRLAFPIYAFMIAEGCRHTRSMPRYFGAMALMALICQIAYFVAMDSLYMCILVTFSISIVLIGLLKKAQQSQSPFFILLFAIGVATALYLCQWGNRLLPGTDFDIDYGFIGVMLPVCLYGAKDKSTKFSVLVLSMTMLAVISPDPYQWYGLLAAPLLLLYNGKRGRWNMKTFFYLFYPMHLAVLYGISYVLK